MLRGCAVKGTGEALLQKALASTILKAFKAFLKAAGAAAKRNNGLAHHFLAIDYAEPAVDIADLLQPTSFTMARLTQVLQQFIPEFSEEKTDAPFGLDNSDIVLFKLLAGTSGRLFVENARQVYLGRADELQLSKQVEGCKADIKRLQAEIAESVSISSQVELKAIYTQDLQEFVKQKKASKPLLADIKNVQQQFESLLDAWCKFPATRVAHILDKMFKGGAGVSGWRLAFLNLMCFQVGVSKLFVCFW